MEKNVNSDIIKQNKKASGSVLNDIDLKLLNNKFLKIKEADNFDDTYYYAERLGVDSVAFILYDSKKNKYGLINEYKPPIGRFLITAFGGSLDKNLPLVDIVKEEVLEEAGYRINLGDIIYLDKIFVSTQMNQFCHLCLVNITNRRFVGKQPQNANESNSNVVWLDKEDIENGQDWKAITILSKLKK